MSTLVCVPITVLEIDAALADANQAKLLGADIVELRIDSYFPGSEGDAEDTLRLNELKRLIAECPLPVILTCRSATEGGDYDGDEADRVSLLEKLCVNAEHPPAYLDFELACYQKSANIRQKINLCVQHPKQERDVRTRLILSMHDFDGRPKDLMRRLSEAWAEPAASVVKFAFRARSIRDNLEIFEILRDAPKPTIGIGMGEFGLMSRVLAPKFGGFLTFASLRDSSATAPGQPTIADLLGMYRFRLIGKDTRLYGVIGWPVAHSMSPLIHNAGFEAVGHNGVYLPMPVPDSDEAFKATIGSLGEESELHFAGASVTIPHKERLVGSGENRLPTDPDAETLAIGAANTIWLEQSTRTHQIWPLRVTNTDSHAIATLVQDSLEDIDGATIALIGAGGVARAAAFMLARANGSIRVFNRSHERAEQLAAEINSWIEKLSPDRRMLQKGDIAAGSLADFVNTPCDIYINCTPVGMTGGPDPEGLSIPVHELAGKLPPETVFFDTVYNPIETPMLKAAMEHGFRTIDGVEMFVRQAAAQFELWTGKAAPVQLFDRLVREKLGSS
ncbi:MAG: type I 3-dehydroquinate dehydratase [Phycisphaerales bacterium]|nr:type I 3-dehydroquinate dehydratase [Phycisphaerales bacterium]MCB9837219.1 type I 3-dehydroquinate dehydratase [Phycisphaera sp.]